MSADFLANAMQFLANNVLVSKAYPAKIVTKDGEVLGFGVFIQEKVPPDLSRFDENAPGAYFLLALASENEKITDFKKLMSYLKEKSEKLKQEKGEEELQRRADALLSQAGEIIAEIMAGGSVKPLMDLMMKAMEMFGSVEKIYLDASAKVKFGENEAYKYDDGIALKIDDMYIAFVPLNKTAYEILAEIEGSLASKFSDAVVSD